MRPRERTYRFWVAGVRLEVGKVVDLPDEEARHAVHVLRLGDGAPVELLNGAGGVASGRVTAVGRRSCEVTVGEVHREPPPEPAMELAFAVPKGRRLDWLLEKATELGARALRPVTFARSVVGGRWSESKRRRWMAHCVAAAKQSGCAWLPTLADPIPLDELLRQAQTTSSEDRGDHRETPGDGGRRGAPLCLLGDGDQNTASWREILETVGSVGQRPRRVVLLVGPEGGLRPGERASAVSAGFRPVRLGCTTLRVETAAVALLSTTVGCWGAGEPAGGV